VLAKAVRARWPDARIGFVSRNPDAVLRDGSFECHAPADHPRHQAAAAREILRTARPDVAVFDNHARTPTLQCARALGASTVFIGTQAPVLEKLFRSRRLLFIDQLWIVQRRFGPEETPLPFSWRLRLALPGSPEVHHLDTIFPEPDAARGRALREKLGVGDRPYLLFAPGGGGYRHDGRSVPEIFEDAASRVQRAVGLPCVVVMGPRFFGGGPAPERVTRVGALAPEEMIDLISGAHVLACGGGGITGQALANGRVCVVAPAGGPDQPERIADCARAGLIEPSPLDAEGLAERVQALAGDDARHEALRQRVVAGGFRNGVQTGLRQLERLADGGTRRPAAAPAG